MFDFPKNPRVTDRCSTDHDTVDLVFLAPSSSLFNRVNVTIAKYRDLDARIAFHIADHRPVCLTFVHLGTRTAMNGQSFDTDILKPFGDFIYILGIIIPAHSGLYSDRNVGSSHHRFGHSHHLVYILQEAASSTAARYVFDRPAVIDID